jgi:SAM-dependent methyltransferase
MFRYNHNRHYSDLLLRQIPAGCRSALDIGCGDGYLVLRMAERCKDVVTGIDRDRAMIEQARMATLDRSSIRFIEGDFMQYSFEEQFDFIVAVASLHHLPFEQALVKMAALLRPGGVLAVLGLFRETGPVDTAVALAAIPVNIYYALSRGKVESGAPIRSPEMSLQEIRKGVSSILPYARLRRLLLWRYLLTWQKA